MNLDLSIDKSMLKKDCRFVLPCIFFSKKNTFSDLDWIFELREAILMSLDFLKSLLALLSLNMKTYWNSMTLEKMAAMIRFYIGIQTSKFPSKSHISVLKHTAGPYLECSTNAFCVEFRVVFDSSIKKWKCE